MKKFGDFIKRFIERNSLSLRVLCVVGFVVASWLMIVQTETVQFNLYALIAMIVGTALSILLSHGVATSANAIKRISKLGEDENPDLPMEIAKLTSYSKLWFRKQFQIVDEELENLNDAFMRRGLQAIRDQEALEDINSMLQWKIAQYRAKQNKHIAVLHSITQHLPVLSVLAAMLVLLGAINAQTEFALATIVAGLSEAILCVACALVLNQFLFKPIIKQIENARDAETKRMQLIAEGIVLVHQQRTPALVFDTLINCIQDTPMIRRANMAFKPSSVEAIVSRGRRPNAA